MQNFKMLLYPLLLIPLLVLLSACRTPATQPAAVPSATAMPPTVTQSPPSDTPSVTPTRTAIPTATHTPSATQPPPTPTPSATAIPSETPTPTATVTATLAENQAPALPSASRGSPSLYLIQVGTGGPVCGDSAVAVSSGATSKGSVESDVSAALQQLFSLKSEYIGGLLNSLYKSNLRVNKVRFNSKNGLITVDLTGTYQPTGDPCDNSRVKAQVWSTVRQYREVKATNIYLNGIPFGDRVSNDK